MKQILEHFKRPKNLALLAVNQVFLVAFATAWAKPLFVPLKDLLELDGFALLAEIVKH